MSEKINVRDIVVLLPGILGSVLGHTPDPKDDVWAISPDAIFKALLSAGKSIESLGFSSLEDGHKDPAPDGLKGTRLFTDLHLVPGLWKIDGYGRIDEELRNHLELVRSDNYFDFPYDWRLDNRLAAVRLKGETDRWLASRRDALHDDNVKLILIAHSMGGLVARYFLERLEGWKDARMLITFGTPYFGSIQALGFLINGYPIRKLGITLFDFSRVIRSFPSLYQLLPTYRAIKVGQGDMLKLRDVVDSIPNADPHEIHDAIDFHDEIAAAVKAHQRDSQYISEAYERHPVVGAEQPTAVWATVESDDRATLHDSYPGQPWTGDGTVPWISAHPKDHPSGIPEAGIYRPEKHGSLQNAEDVLLEVRNLVARLAAVEAVNVEVPRSGISLQIQDWNDDGTIEIVARCDIGPLHAEISNATVSSGEVVESVKLSSAGGTYRGRVSGLPTGTYRVKVRSEGPARPVTDTCMVMNPSIPM